MAVLLPARQNKIPHVQRALARWFRAHQRDLPWRRTRDPYRILVSEIMLQQTPVDRVVSKYQEFLRRFPTVRALARASPRAVLLAWAGMGYNRRALYLLRAARQVVGDHAGNVPTDPAVLRGLPGVGSYTAAAVATFSTGVPHALADTNIRRVIGRVFLGKSLPRSSVRSSERALRRIIEKTTPRRPVSGMSPVLWGHAVMDFGALVCRAKPRCEICPLQQRCRAYPVFQRVRGQLFKRAGSRDSRVRRFPNAHAVVPDRIFRGKILQRVRDGDPRPVLVSLLRPLVPGQSTVVIRRLLRGLIADGILVWDGPHRVHLPGLRGSPLVPTSPAGAGRVGGSP